MEWNGTQLHCPPPDEKVDDSCQVPSGVESAIKGDNVTAGIT